MRIFTITLTTLGLLTLISCGPSAEEKAQQKSHEDSLVNAAVSATVKEMDKQNDADVQNKIKDLQSKIQTAEEELNALNNDPNYLYVKTRLETVRARVSTGAGYGWIDKDGKFWQGKDASKGFDDAAALEKSQLEKIAAKNAEIKSMEEKIKEFKDLLTK